jgi:hypothetical protein
MWFTAFEIVCITRAQDLSFTIDRDLEPSRKDDTAFLALMRERDLAGICARRVTFS